MPVQTLVSATNTDLILALSVFLICRSTENSSHMGATHGRDVPLPDDAACEAMLRTFIALDLERAERLLRRADEQLGGC